MSEPKRRADAGRMRTERHGCDMRGKSGYFVVKQKAVPEVLLKVVEAKRLVESGKAVSIQEAVDAVGMYSGADRKMIFCVVSKKEIVTLREIVQEIDKQAFMIVSDVREVFGEGFIEY